MDWLTVSSLPRAPRSTQTGHKSPVNGVPQTGQARLLFVFTTFAPGASSVVVDLVSHGSHKIIIGGMREGVAEISLPKRSKNVTFAAEKVATRVAQPGELVIPLLQVFGRKLILAPNENPDETC
jgi:hypothetical protein